MPLDDTNYRPEPRTQTAKDLLAAAAWLETHRWCQGSLGVTGTRTHVLHDQETWRTVGGCAGVAIRVGVVGDNLLVAWPKAASRRLEAAHQAMKQVLNLPRSHGVPAWNDMPGRTKEEVVAALRAAARHADECEIAYVG